MGPKHESDLYGARKLREMHLLVSAYGTKRRSGDSRKQLEAMKLTTKRLVNGVARIDPLKRYEREQKFHEQQAQAQQAAQQQQGGQGGQGGGGPTGPKQERRERRARAHAPPDPYAYGAAARPYNGGVQKGVPPPGEKFQGHFTLASLF